jgi:hypothetical protein
MIQWVAFKAFMKRAWAWFKHYWYFPVMVVIAIVSWCFGRRDSAGILEMFEISKENYQKEIAVLKESHEEEIRKRNELISSHDEALKKLESEYKIEIGKLSGEEKKEIEKIVEEHKNDPDGLAKKMSEVFGIEHVE